MNGTDTSRRSILDEWTEPAPHRFPLDGGPAHVYFLREPARRETVLRFFAGSTPVFRVCVLEDAHQARHAVTLVWDDYAHRRTLVQLCSVDGPFASLERAVADTVTSVDAITVFRWAVAETDCILNEFAALLRPAVDRAPGIRIVSFWKPI